MAKKSTKTKARNIKKKSSFSRGSFTLFVLIFAAVGAFTLWVSFAAAPSSSSLIFSNVFRDLQYPVEQASPNFFNCGGSAGPINCAFDESTWVKNPSNCIWDLDDSIQDRAAGGLSAKTSASDTSCLINDGLYSFGHRHVSALVTAPTSNLTVTLANDQGVSQTAKPSYQNKSYQYLICTYDSTEGPYPVIDGSNGGSGVLVNYTLSITNPSSKSVRNVVALLTMGGSANYSSGC